MSKYSLLYIEDEIYIRTMVVEYLQRYFQTIYQASNGKEALRIYEEKKPDMIITDIEMPQMNGLEFASRIRQKDEQTLIVILTAHSKTEYLLKAIELNLVKYLIKPLDEEELLEALENSFKKIESKNPSVFRLTEHHYYDTYNHTLVYKDELIPLSSSQYQLLDILLDGKNRMVTYSEIEHSIWTQKAMSSSALRSLVHNTRLMIDKNIIKNVSKIGYKIRLYEPNL